MGGVPTVNELLTIVDSSRTDVTDPVFPLTSTSLWTSTPLDTVPGDGWAVVFGNVGNAGYAVFGVQTGATSVRCVR